MINYSIIIPVYNRLTELESCLACLLRQDYPVEEFEIIIADDGSIEDTLSLVRKVAKSFDRIKYFWQPDKGFRAGQARNRGVDLIDKSSDTIIFLDSDIIFKSDWLSTYARIQNEFPEAIICGRYDFLLPMRVSADDVLNRFDEVVSNRLPVLYIPKGEYLGADMRLSLFQRDKTLIEEGKGQERPLSGSGGAMFGGNVLISVEAFYNAGGFDEKIVLHGGEDSDAGQTLDELGWKFIFTEESMGWHIYHKRDQEKNKRDLRINIDYIDKKHGKK